MTIAGILTYLVRNGIRYFHLKTGYHGTEEFIVDLGKDWILKVAINDDGDIVSVSREKTTFRKALEEATIHVATSYKDIWVHIFGTHELTSDRIEECIRQIPS